MCKLCVAARIAKNFNLSVARLEAAVLQTTVVGTGKRRAGNQLQAAVLYSVRDIIAVAECICRFRGAYCKHISRPDDEHSRYLCNVGKLLPDYAASSAICKVGLV
jgi:hypothetical protein